MNSEESYRVEGRSCQAQQEVEAPAADPSSCRAGAPSACNVTAQPTEGTLPISGPATDSWGEPDASAGAEATTLSSAAIDETAGEGLVASTPADSQLGEKVCSTCGATRTPMWRNDSSGNKTLCNACGVRLQRQQNKAKSRQVQQEASQSPGGRLAEGKLPRARTSPAKLSLRIINLSRSQSQESLAGGLISLNMAAAARAASPRDGMGSSPSPPSKRKSGSEANLTNAERAAEQKRMRNPAGSPSNKEARVSVFAVRNVDLLVPAKELGDKHRIKGVVALLEDLTRADAIKPGFRHPITEGSSCGGAHCVLSIFTGDKQRVAMCSNPGPHREATYVAEYGGLVWDSPARWSLAFNTSHSYNQFKLLLQEWVSRQQKLSSMANVDPASQQRFRPPDQQPGSSLRTGFSAVYRCDADDATFLEYVNSVQSQQLAEQAPQQQGQAEVAVADPKSVHSPLTAQTFECLIDAFEMVSARAGMVEGLPLRAAAALCERCAWAPNKAVGMAVYNYWTSKRNARCQQPLVPLYWQKSPTPPLTSPSALSPHPHPSLSRSFSASPPLTLTGSSIFAPLDSGPIEGSAWNSMEVPATALSKRAESVASDDSAQLISLFSSDANGTRPRATNSAALPPLGSLSGRLALNFDASNEFNLENNLLGSLPSPAMHSLSQPMAWNRDSSLFSQTRPGDQEMGSASGEMLDPLDPAFLAGIHDPRESRPADTEELSDQTSDPGAAQRLGLVASETAAVEPVGEDELGGFMMPRPFGVSSEGAQTQDAAKHSPLRRVMSAIDAPEATLRAGSPATPTSKNNLRLRHASLDYSTPNRHLFPDIYAPSFSQENLSAAERGEEDPLGKLFVL